MAFHVRHYFAEGCKPSTEKAYLWCLKASNEISSDFIVDLIGWSHLIKSSMNDDYTWPFGGGHSRLLATGPSFQMKIAWSTRPSFYLIADILTKYPVAE